MKTRALNNHQYLTGEFHKHCRKSLGFKKIASRKRRSILKEITLQEQNMDSL